MLKQRFDCSTNEPVRTLERAGAQVVECACVIGLPKFKVSLTTTLKFKRMIYWAV